ncbi:hypothetical protein MKW92_020391 [Papaver armeniacum]|nr:hypothetical protein MKW92_020391 [Papaver armeniacum]
MQTSRFLKPFRESFLQPQKGRIFSCFSHHHSNSNSTVSEEEQQQQSDNTTHDLRGLLNTYTKRRTQSYNSSLYRVSSNDFLNFSRINSTFGGGGVSYNHRLLLQHGFCTKVKVADVKKTEIDDPSQRAVTTALWANFLVFSLKFGVWMATSSHVMLAEMIHSIADFANQALLAYGLWSSKRAPDAIHPYGYSKERFVWSLISAVGIFCLGAGATIVHGFQNLWTTQPPGNIKYAALVIAGSFIIEGWCCSCWSTCCCSLIGGCEQNRKSIYDPIGSIVVGNLLGMVAIFLIQRNRHALIGRAIDDYDMQRVLHFLKNDPVVDALYDCKSEVIGPGFFRFKAEIDFNGVVVVQNYLERTGRGEWAKQFRDAGKDLDDATLLRTMSNYGEEVVTALGSEVDRLEKEIQKLVPGIRHVDIEAHNPEKEIQKIMPGLRLIDPEKETKIMSGIQLDDPQKESQKITPP